MYSSKMNKAFGLRASVSYWAWINPTRMRAISAAGPHVDPTSLFPLQNPIIPSKNPQFSKFKFPSKIGTLISPSPTALISPRGQSTHLYVHDRCKPGNQLNQSKPSDPGSTVKNLPDLASGRSVFSFKNRYRLSRFHHHSHSQSTLSGDGF